MAGERLWRAFVAGTRNWVATDAELREMLQDLDVKLLQLPKPTRLAVVKRIAAKPARSFPFTVAQAAGALLEMEPALREEALILLGGAMPFLPPEERAFYFYFLFEAMESEDHRVRIAAFGVLMKLGAQAEEFIPYIEKMLEDGRPETRKTAVRVLLSIGTPKATNLLERVSHADPDPDVRRLAGRMLEALR